MEDIRLFSKIRTALADKSDLAIKYGVSENTFFEKLIELAYQTWANKKSLVIEQSMVDNLSTLPGYSDFLIGIALQSSIIDKTNNDGLAFRDQFQRDIFSSYFLIKYLGRDYFDTRLRDQAVNTLMLLGIAAVPALIKALGSGDSAVPLAASVVLKRSGSEIVPDLIQAIEYGNDTVRRYAIGALATPEKAKIASNELLKILKDDPSPMVRVASIDALKENPSQEVVETFINFLSDSDPLVRMMIKAALEKIDMPLARRALEEAKKNPTPNSSSVREETNNQKNKSTSHPPRVFLSYPHELKEKVDKIRQLLKTAGFNVWIDSQSILSGQKWEHQIVEALESSDLVIGFLSSHTMLGFQLKELQLAIEKKPQGRAQDIPFLLPCVVDNVLWENRPDSLPEFLREFHVINFSNFETGWNELLTAAQAAARASGFMVPIYLRTKSNFDLQPHSMNRMLIQKNFYDYYQNPEGQPPYVLYGGLKSLINGVLIEDVSTGRIWTQQTFNLGKNQLGNPDNNRIGIIKEWVKELNKKGFAGFFDWRLPTIEEAMSLMTPLPRIGGLHISELFSDDQVIVSSDLFSPGYNFPWLSWFAYYGAGYSASAPLGELPDLVRLVRSTIS